MSNVTLKNAKKDKCNEFYTQYEDIQQELNHSGYLKEFYGKTIYCNCDDPEWSNFWKYFKLRFNELKLKSLISTHYESNGDSSYMLRYDGINTIKSELAGNGDFRSEECIELLKEADVVVTNPPFSLFREYIAQLMKYNKKFIVWGNNNSIGCKEIFPLLKNNEMWLGYTANQTKIFEVPSTYRYNVELTQKKNDGKYYSKVPSISTYTNIDIEKRHERLYLTSKYSPEDYPKYDNYEAIDIGYICDIPKDYNGIMGVPITFLDKFNPEQFEIIGIGSGDSAKEIGITRNYRGRTDLAITKNGVSKCPYHRILIKKKENFNNED